jgi:hypothetical protein
MSKRDEAIEAAAKELYESTCSAADGKTWETVDECVRASSREEIRRTRRAYEQALEKAADMKRCLGCGSLKPRLCGVVSNSGRLGEPLACAWEPDHNGPHSWATLPTFAAEPDATRAGAYALAALDLSEKETGRVASFGDKAEAVINAATRVRDAAREPVEGAEAARIALHERRAECVARDYAKPRRLDFLAGWHASRKYWEPLLAVKQQQADRQNRRAEDAEGAEARLREGLERALDVSFTVGLLRLRAKEQDDAELHEWGEKLRAQLVAIREVLSPGTAAFMAEQRVRERALAEHHRREER